MDAQHTEAIRRRKRRLRVKRREALHVHETPDNALMLYDSSKDGGGIGLH